MNIHLIRSEGFDEGSFGEVVDLLQKFEGPLKFITSSYDPKIEEEKIWREELDEEEYSKKKMPAMDEEHAAMSAPMEFPVERYTASVNDLLAACTDYRKEQDIGDEEFVILLTEVANELNWFSYGWEKGKDIFIHAEGWDYFVDSDLRFPLAHQVASNILQMLMFDDMEKLMAALARGDGVLHCGERKIEKGLKHMELKAMKREDERSDFITSMFRLKDNAMATPAGATPAKHRDTLIGDPVND